MTAKVSYWPERAKIALSHGLPIRPNISTAVPAGFANEVRLDIGQSDVIGPPIGTHALPVAAVIVCAIDQQPAHAHVVHVSEGDLLRAI
jgi:hypothetical protein